MNINDFLAQLVRIDGVSDLHFKVGSPPLLRINGELRPAKFQKLTPQNTRDIALSLVNENVREKFDELRDFDTAYSVPGVARFRVNLFRQRGTLGVVLRKIPLEVPTLDKLGMPETIKKLAMEERGMVLVTGVTGSGKSSTLAGMINHINQHKRVHILTIEDPIEFLYSDNMAAINQREVGLDTESFATSLRAALRQDPDVILVGEMRDVETISIAIKAAETGHLVFSTLHTLDATETVNRIIDSFPPHQQGQIRYQLASTLKGVISQRLLPRSDGRGRIAAVEVMVCTELIKEYIIDPDKTMKIKDAIENGKMQYGMQSFDQHLTELYRNNDITLETAVAAAASPADFQRALMFQ
ncbi:MAG: type IV pilus twitching motility protein PilT [Gemmatimonadetes bacterium]|nr:MAG: type IV pilus twitching motility protein PilT [Gemmatimonadota bacterium]